MWNLEDLVHFVTLILFGNIYIFSLIFIGDIIFIVCRLIRIKIPLLAKRPSPLSWLVKIIKLRKGLIFVLLIRGGGTKATYSSSHIWMAIDILWSYFYWLIPIGRWGQQFVHNNNVLKWTIGIEQKGMYMIFANLFSFSSSLICLGGKRKRGKNNQSRYQKLFLSARSQLVYTRAGILVT